MRLDLPDYAVARVRRALGTDDAQAIADAACIGAAEVARLRELERHGMGNPDTVREVDAIRQRIKQATR